MMKTKQARFWRFLGLLAACGSLGLGAAWGQPEVTDDEVTFGEDGTSLVELTEELFATVEVPVSLDGEEELNPVSEETLISLATRRSPSAIVFQKYAFIPNISNGVCHVANGAGTRNTGYGTIRLRGAPPRPTPVAAFLFWAQIINTPPPFFQLAFINGAPVFGFLMGTSASPCWPGNTLAAYQAFVLPQILAGINGDYSITGLPSGLTNGQNPWKPPTVLPLSEGTSLVVLYTAPCVPRGTWTQIHRPINFIPPGQVFGTFNFCHRLILPLNNVVKHTRIGADGQVGGGLSNFSAIASEATYIAAPCGAPRFQIRGCGAYPFGNPDSDWNGHDGVPLNQLWDTQTMACPGVVTGPPAPDYEVRYVANADCIIPIVHVITGN